MALPPDLADRLVGVRLGRHERALLLESGGGLIRVNEPDRPEWNIEARTGERRAEAVARSRAARKLVALGLLRHGAIVTPVTTSLRKLALMEAAGVDMSPDVREPLRGHYVWRTEAGDAVVAAFGEQLRTGARIRWRG
jgi:hypothetical protein